MKVALDAITPTRASVCGGGRFFLEAARAVAEVIILARSVNGHQG